MTPFSAFLESKFFVWRENPHLVQQPGHGTLNAAGTERALGSCRAPSQALRWAICSLGLIPTGKEAPEQRPGPQGCSMISPGLQKRGGGE